MTLSGFCQILRQCNNGVTARAADSKKPTENRGFLKWSITRSSSDQKLTVTVEGAGRLQAFGSARPCMSENFYSDTHTTFYGKALAVIRAGYEPGEITVTVSGEGLESRSFTITVE